MNNIRTVSDISVGDILRNNHNECFTIINITNAKNIEIKYNDSYGYSTITRADLIARGNLRNPYRPAVYDRGFMGTGEYLCRVNNKFTPEYQAWQGMMQRCYSQSYQNRQPTYNGCSVCPEWFNFQIFAEWYCSHKLYGNKYELDKDILHPGNKLYSPQTCTLLPSVINTIIQVHLSNRELPQGVVRNKNNYAARFNKKYLGTYPTIIEAAAKYNTVKKDYIGKLILEWKDKLEPRAYIALLAHYNNLCG